MLKRYVGRLQSGDNPDLALKRGLVDLAVDQAGKVYAYNAKDKSVIDVAGSGSEAAIETIEAELSASYYNKDQVDKKISELDTEVFVPVTELPEYSEDFKENKIYLLPVSGSTEENNKFTEYKGTVVEVEGVKSISWEIIGNPVTVDLSGYYKKEEVDVFHSASLEAAASASAEATLASSSAANAEAVATDATLVAASASVDAKNAVSASSEAASTASYALSSAVSASETATSASNLVSKVADTSSYALSKASGALAVAEAASASAENAAITASNADAVAASASIKASEALDSASEAKGLADDASTLASDAYKHADDIKISADEAAYTASLVSRSLSGVSESAFNAGESATRAENLANSASVTASIAYDLASSASAASKPVIYGILSSGTDEGGTYQQIDLEKSVEESCRAFHSGSLEFLVYESGSSRDSIILSGQVISADTDCTKLVALLEGGYGDPMNFDAYCEFTTYASESVKFYINDDNPIYGVRKADNFTVISRAKVKDIVVNDMLSISGSIEGVAAYLQLTDLDGNILSNSRIREYYKDGCIFRFWFREISGSNLVTRDWSSMQLIIPSGSNQQDEVIVKVLGNERPNGRDLPDTSHENNFTYLNWEGACYGTDTFGKVVLDTNGVAVSGSFYQALTKRTIEHATKTDDGYAMAYDTKQFVSSSIAAIDLPTGSGASPLYAYFEEFEENGESGIKLTLEDGVEEACKAVREGRASTDVFIYGSGSSKEEVAIIAKVIGVEEGELAIETVGSGIDLMVPSIYGKFKTTEDSGSLFIYNIDNPYDFASKGNVNLINRPEIKDVVLADMLAISGSVEGLSKYIQMTDIDHHTIETEDVIDWIENGYNVRVWNRTIKDGDGEPVLRIAPSVQAFVSTGSSDDKLIFRFLGSKPKTIIETGSNYSYITWDDYCAAPNENGTFMMDNTGMAVSGSFYQAAQKMSLSYAKEGMDGYAMALDTKNYISSSIAASVPDSAILADVVEGSDETGSYYQITLRDSKADAAGKAINGVTNFIALEGSSTVFAGSIINVEVEGDKSGLTAKVRESADEYENEYLLFFDRGNSVKIYDSLDYTEEFKHITKLPVGLQIGAVDEDKYAAVLLSGSTVNVAANDSISLQTPGGGLTVAHKSGVNSVLLANGTSSVMMYNNVFSLAVPSASASTGSDFTFNVNQTNGYAQIKQTSRYSVTSSSDATSSYQDSMTVGLNGKANLALTAQRINIDAGTIVSKGVSFNSYGLFYESSEVITSASLAPYIAKIEALEAVTASLMAASASFEARIAALEAK